MSATRLQIALICAATVGLISTQPLSATVGGSVLIPCLLPGYPLSLRWFYWQEDKSQNVLFHWDTRGNPQPVAEKYKNRCHVFEFKSGNISIRLDNVAVEDDQKTFWAYVRLYDEQKKTPKLSEQMCEFKLQVSAPYQHLDLTVNSTAKRATCTAHGGYPEPQISWTGRNRSGAAQLDLQDAETSLQQDPTNKTFSVTSSVSVKELQSVTCCVYNPRANQRVEETVKIDEDQQKPRYFLIGIIVPLVIIFIIFISTLICLWYHRERLTCERCPQQTGTETPTSPLPPLPPPPPSVSGGDVSEGTVLLSEDRASFHRPAVSTAEDTDRPGAAAGEQKEELSQKGNDGEARTSEGVRDK